MKGIAIQTILLLVVGILVVGILVYLVYRYSSSSTTLSTTECLSLLTNYCTTCMVSDWSTAIVIPADVQTCGDQIRASGALWSDNVNCGNGGNGGNERGNAINDCCNTVGIGCGDT